MKKSVFKIVCAISLIAVTSASAEWRFAGYDTTEPPVYGKIYNEVLNGKYTSKQKVDPVNPDDVEWKFEGYELAYPHAGYERLYLEGNAQKAITRTTSQFPQWETRFRDYMWEVSGDHRIYQRQQTKINNSFWAWDFGKDAYDESLVFVPTTRFADVTVDYRDYGVANLDLNGNYVFDVNGVVYNDEKYTLYEDFGVMPEPFNVELDDFGNPTKQIVGNDKPFYEEYNPETDDWFCAAHLSELDATNQYAVADWDIAEMIDNMQSKFVTGPSYYGENGTKDVAAMYYDHLYSGWDWDDDVVVKNHDAKISWTEPEYEMAEPYFYYQYLIVNGVKMDGHNDTPRIYRYTWGKANPDVKWKFAFVESAYPYNIVEYKYIKGNDGKWVQAFDEDGNPEYRYPTGDFGRSYFKVTDTEIQYWVRTEDNGDYLLDSISRVDADFGDWYEGYVNAAGYVTQ